MRIVLLVVVRKRKRGPHVGAPVAVRADVGATARQPPGDPVKPVKAKVRADVIGATVPLAAVARNPSAEDALLDRLAARLRARHDAVALGIGDDAAILGDGWCASLDLLVEDVHFRLRTTTPADLGWKALAVNLSDLAAMGAEPVAGLVGLGIPPATDPAVLDALFDGLDACAARYGAQVAGGDMSRAVALTLAVAVFGRCAAPVRRDGGRPGDLVCVTGALGGSRAGLALLEGLALDLPERDALVARHVRPEPRVAEGRALGPHVRAMMDVSDGLASDVRRLARASGTAVRIDLDAVPAQAGVAAVAAAQGRTAGWFAAAGGEDYELVCAVPPEAIGRAGVPLTVVGELEAGEPGAVRFTGAGSDDPPRGYDHLLV
jgi:thiamine-monophosphate kinase